MENAPTGGFALEPRAMNDPRQQGDTAEAQRPVSPTAQDAVRKSFNPSGNPDVTYIKGLTSQLIEFMEGVRDRNKGLAGREAAVAITNIQTASMWSVLAATKEAPKAA